MNIVASASFDPMVITIAGKRTDVIAGIDQRLPDADVIERKEDMDSGRIKSLADLAGKLIVVSAPKSASWMMGTQMVETAGLTGVEIRGTGDAIHAGSAEVEAGGRQHGHAVGDGFRAEGRLGCTHRIDSQSGRMAEGHRPWRGCSGPADICARRIHHGSPGGGPGLRHRLDKGVTIS
ncbi:MAG: hypothetical protein FJY55_01855 [Betaproteobacteria bacterium]|nr:hypothetical protein [Betaproteobacteria bacterium]